MRFDLEVPASNNVELTYIKEGNDISNGVVPLLYFEMNSRDMFPADFITAEVNYAPREFVVGGYDVVHGPLIEGIRGDQFLLTDVAVSNGLDTQLIPLFYRHEIPYSVKESGLRIVDYFGVPLSKDSYFVDERPATTMVYMNKTDKVMFIEYVSSNRINRSLLNLVPVFREAGWDDVVTGEIATEKYVVKTNRIETSHDEILYLAYKSDTQMLKAPAGNLEDQWYARILNADFSSNGTRYRVPEYYMQELTSDFKYKLVSHKKCRHLFGSYIQSQFTISENNTNIDVFVHDKYSGLLKSAYSTNIDIEGSIAPGSTDVFYRTLNDFNLDGVIALPVDLQTNEVAYATHYTNEPYLEYKGIDLNSRVVASVDYVILYLRPNVSDTTPAVGHVTIGTKGTSTFETIEEYIAATNDTSSPCYNAFTIATLKVSTNLVKHDYRMIDVSSPGNTIASKYMASKASPDILYKDILDGNISVPVNDTVVVAFDARRMIEQGKIVYDIKTNIMNEFGKRYLKKIDEIIQKNLDASTAHVLEVNI